MLIKVKIIQTYFPKYIKIMLIIALILTLMAFLTPILFDMQHLFNRIVLILIIFSVLIILISVKYKKNYFENGFITFKNDELFIETINDNFSLSYKDINKLTITYCGYKDEPDPGLISVFKSKRGNKNFIVINTGQNEYKYELLFENIVVMRVLKKIFNNVTDIKFEINENNSEKFIDLI